MNLRQRHDRYTAASLARPLLRLARITRRPVWDLIRARKPEVLLRLRLVPPKVRLVMESYLANLKKSQSSIVALTLLREPISLQKSAL